jgi:ZipA, C-terminal FtsZ-binding domain
MDKLIPLIKGLDPLVLGLAGLGVLVILAVIVINWFQTRKVVDEAAPLFPAPAPAPAPIAFARNDEERMEPTLNGRSPPPSQPQDAPNPAKTAPQVSARASIKDAFADDMETTGAFTAPVVATPQPAAAVANPDHVDIALDPAQADTVSLSPVGPREPTAPIDGRVHSIVKLRFGHSVAASDARRLAERVAGRFPRGQAWVWSSLSSAWTSVRQGQGTSLPAADAIAFSMPLATRNGAVTESTLREWMNEIEDGGREHAAEMVYAPVNDDAKRAVELDAFCGNIDLLAGVNLMRADHSAIPGTRLRGTLEAEGFHLNEAGAFEMKSEDGQHVVYEIRNAHGQAMTADSLRADGVHGLALSLDVMRVPNPVQHFDMMRTLAKRLATRLEAVVVDDRGHALTDALMQQIRGELEKRVTAARAAGIEPGSPLARTLFGD